MMNKKLFIILSMAALLACFGVMPAQAIPTVSLNVLDSYIEVSESFDVEVWVGDSAIGEALLGFGFDVVTPGTYFSYDGYAIGTDFVDLPPSNPNNVSGGGGAFTDDVLLATLSFTGLTAGTDSLQTVGLYDGWFYGLFYETIGLGFDIDAATNITVNSAPIPEPATMLLLGSGLVGLMGLGRKKFGRR